MTTQTTGRVFRLAERFVRASGTAVRLLFPLKSDSAGWTRLLKAAPPSLWITEVIQTAKRIDWPPDRRNFHTADSSPPQTTLQRMFTVQRSPTTTHPRKAEKPEPNRSVRATSSEQNTLRTGQHSEGQDPDESRITRSSFIRCTHET